MSTELSATSPADAEPCCTPVQLGEITDEAAVHLARKFKALGDPTRVKLLSLIAGAADGEACICDLTDPVGLSQPTVSHHMKQLVDAGLATGERRGRWTYYRTVPSELSALAEALGQSVAQGGSRPLASPGE